MLGTSANRSASPQIRKLRTQGFGLRICGPISYRKHLRICGKKIEIYRKSAKSTTSLRLFLQFLKNTYLPVVESRTQGLRPRTKDTSASALKKKQNRTSEKIFRRSPKKPLSKKFFRRSTNF